MKRYKVFLVFIVAGAIASLLVAARACAQDIIINPAKEIAEAQSFNEELIDSAEGKDVDFYRAAYKKIKIAIQLQMQEAVSEEESVRTLSVYALGLKRIFYRLSSSSAEEDLQLATEVLSLCSYVFTIINKREETLELANAALKCNDEELKTYAQFTLEELKNVEQRSMDRKDYLLSLFQNAFGKADEASARVLVDTIVDEAVTNDYLLDSLSTVAIMAKGWNAARYVGVYGELVKRAERAFSQSHDSRRREKLKWLTPELELVRRYEAGQKRFNALPGAEMKVDGFFLDGTTIDWERYRGKVTLVLVWEAELDLNAIEIVNVLKEYRRYHDSGFEVLAYSVDQDLDKLRQFLTNAKLPWKTASNKITPTANGLSDKERFDLREYYGIELLPCMILVDRDGKAFDTNARGKRLNALLRRLIPEPCEPESETLAVCQSSLDALYESLTKRMRERLEKDGDNISTLAGMTLYARYFERCDESEQYKERAISRELYRAEALERFAWEIASYPTLELRSGELALEMAQSAAEMKEYKSPSSLLVLALSYAALDDFESAASWAERAFELAQSEVEDEEEREFLVVMCRRIIELAKEKKPIYWRPFF